MASVVLILVTIMLTLINTVMFGDTMVNDNGMVLNILLKVNLNQCGVQLYSAIVHEQCCMF